jgi:hypothetical protein
MGLAGGAAQPEKAMAEQSGTTSLASAIRRCGYRTIRIVKSLARVKAAIFRRLS